MELKKPCREGLGNIHCSGFYDVRSPDSILVAVQCDHGGQRLGCVDFDLVVPTDSTWAEIAEHLGKIVELQAYSQQNIVSDHHGHPVLV